MRAAVVAEYYPRPADPASGVWAHRQALATRAAGAHVEVLALERPVPPAAAFAAAARGDARPLARALGASLRTPRRTTRDGIDVEYVRFLSPPRERSYESWHRYARRPLARALAHRDVELVHAHYALPSGAAAFAFTARRGLPLVVSVHGGDVLAPVLSSQTARARVAAVLRHADGVLCNSRGTLERAAALAGRGEHMRVVHLGAEAPATLPPRHGEPTVATLAHVIPRKRHEDVALALARLPGTRWRIIGDGPELPRVRALAERLGVPLTATGRLAPADALVELARCHALAMPSEDEAFGVAYVEALACGLPAIGCAGESGPDEIAERSAAMLLVPPRDPPALAAAIERALGDDGTLRAAARADAARDFSWRATGEQTFAAYASALAT